MVDGCLFVCVHVCVMHACLPRVQLHVGVQNPRHCRVTRCGICVLHGADFNAIRGEQTIQLRSWGPIQIRLADALQVIRERGLFLIAMALAHAPFTLSTVNSIF